MLLLLLSCARFPDAGVAPAPPLAESDRIRIAAVGDSGKGTEEQRRVAAAVERVCAERGCDALLLLGDNLYPRGMSGPDDPRIREVITDIYGDARPTYIALGNHDYGNGLDDQAATWQVEWANRQTNVHLPAHAYSWRAGPVAFFALDTTWMFWRGEATQARWLREAMAASDATWKVVYGHHPFKSNAGHGNAGRYEGRFLPWEAGRPLQRIFEDELCGQADVYLSGHDHNLQWIQHCGTDLVVSGAGATARVLVDRGNEPIFSKATLGFAWLEFTDEGRLAFFDGDGTLLHEGSLDQR